MKELTKQTERIMLDACKGGDALNVGRALLLLSKIKASVHE